MGKNKIVKIRILILSSLLILVGLFYSIRLVDLQIVKGEDYYNQLNRGSSRTQVIEAARGEIVDRNGVVLTGNRTSYDVVFDRAFMPSETQNEIIAETILLMEAEGALWEDALPISETAPYAFDENSDSEISRLQNLLNVGSYTSGEDAFIWLKERYGLEDLEDTTARKVAGVRYGMEISQFSISNPYVFARDVDVNTAVLIGEQGYRLSGVSIDETAVREYTDGDLIPHVLGRIGPIFPDELSEKLEEGYIATDLIGKDGIEAAYESELKGTDGKRSVYIDAQGEVIDVVEEEAPIPGKTIQLTIDAEIQRVAIDALEAKIKSLNETAPAGQGKEADAGAVVAIDVKTGEVLALVTYPTYDQSSYNQDYNELIQNPLNPMYNRALLGRYAPGSTFKPSVGIATLNEGIETAFSTVLCTGIYTHYSDYQPACLGVHGNLNLVYALTVSCNSYFYDVGRRLGIDLINQYAGDLGFGSTTGVELSEYEGRLSTPEVAEQYGEFWSAGRVIASAIGQGYNEFSPIQFANYTATLANRGERMDLNLVKGITSYDGEETFFQATPTVVNDMDYVDPAHFETVIDGMVAASRVGTAAYDFGSYFVDVASKTGTPETSALPNSTFIAFAPADDPEIAVAVIIEKGWHGYTGAPVAKEVFTKYFELYGEGETALPEYMLPIEELPIEETSEETIQTVVNTNE